MFFDSNPHVYNSEFLSWIKNKISNSTLSLIFVNSMKSRNMRDVDYFKKYFQNIYTIDSEDAKNFGFTHIEGIHSQIVQMDRPIENDITFAGFDKGRGNYLAELYYHLLNKGITCDFTVVNMSNPPEGINTKRISYAEVLNKELSSRCILEICVGEQHANTLRALEAIMYDKVFLTNNQNIKNSKFYCSDMMFVFENINEILKWNIPKITHSYNYNGEYSPIRLLEDIARRNTQLRSREIIT